MTEREVLRRTKEVLLERGWHQGGYTQGPLGDGPVCLRGAANIVVSGDVYNWTDDGEEATGLLIRILIAEGGGARLAAWNDQPGRTFDEVIGLIDRAIASLRAEDREPVAA